MAIQPNLLRVEQQLEEMSQTQTFETSRNSASAEHELTFTRDPNVPAEVWLVGGKGELFRRGLTWLAEKAGSGGKPSGPIGPGGKKPPGKTQGGKGEKGEKRQEQQDMDRAFDQASTSRAAEHGKDIGSHISTVDQLAARARSGDLEAVAELEHIIATREFSRDYPDAIKQLTELCKSPAAREAATKALKNLLEKPLTTENRLDSLSPAQVRDFLIWWIKVNHPNAAEILK